MPTEKPIDGNAVPQADSLPKVRELVQAVAARARASLRDAGLAAGLSTRHASYYGRAAETLNLLESIDGDRYRLAELGHRLLETKPSSVQERAVFAEAIKQSEILNRVAPDLLRSEAWSRDALASRIETIAAFSPSTAHRRAGTLLAWRTYLTDPENLSLPGIVTPERASPQRRGGEFLEVQSFGPISSARIEFGDLTVLVGPQATGKSLLLQLWKLAIDRPFLIPFLRRSGLVIDSPEALLDVYLGEGMSSAWSAKTLVASSHDALSLSNLNTLRGTRERVTENVFFVPAHRSLLITDSGWPLPFQLLKNAPVVARTFAERLANDLSSADLAMFPHPRKLKAALRAVVDDAVFHGARLEVDVVGRQRQMRLKYGEKTNLGYMSWTAGQREFVPLLLGLYQLLPSGSKPKDDAIDWVIVEEPEMGLHPQAILAVLLLLFELIERGYRVAVTTHAPIVLDVVWALRQLQVLAGRGETVKAVGLFRDMFGLRSEPGINSLGAAVLAKTLRVFALQYGEDGRAHSSDISDLDPAAEDSATAGWGGLTAHSGRITDVVGAAIAELRAAADEEST